jgi:hypothetical protein
MSTRQRDPKTGRFLKSGVETIDMSEVTVEKVERVHREAWGHIAPIGGTANYAIKNDPYWDVIVNGLKSDNYRKSIEITNLQLAAKAKDKLLEERRELIDTRDLQIDALNQEVALSNRDVRIAVWVAVVLFCAVCWVWFGKELLLLGVLGGGK